MRTGSPLSGGLPSAFRPRSAVPTLAVRRAGRVPYFL